MPQLADPDTDALNLALQQLPRTAAALVRFDPDTVPGLVASWGFDELKDGAFPANQHDVPSIPTNGDSTCVPGKIGKAARLGSDGVKVPLNLKDALRNGCTFSFWVKSDPKLNGILLNLNELSGLSLDFQGDSLRLNAQGRWSFGGNVYASMVTSWTHLAITIDRKTMAFYRDGMPVMTLPVDKPINFAGPLTLGKGFSGAFDDLRIYNNPLDAATIQRIYLKGYYAQ